MVVLKQIARDKSHVLHYLLTTHTHISTTGFDLLRHFHHFMSGQPIFRTHLFLLRQLTSSSFLLFMAALRSRCGHYIFALWFLPSSSFFFPRLISAVAQWMSTILLHNDVALVRIQNAGLKCAARGSLEIHHAKMTQKIAILAPSNNTVGLNLRN